MGGNERLTVFFYYLVAMLYRFGWTIMWVTFRIFFRKIDVLGAEKLQHGKPAILIANHPASFLDAMVLAVFLGRPIHFYVRGDIFSHPLVYRILTKLHMIPIFSREHGTGNLAKNKATFDRGRKLLSAGNLLLIFPEGFSRQSKQAEPFKKGAARVALQTAFDDGKADHLCIQTVALNYSHHGFGANLFIRVGDTHELGGYETAYRDFPAQAVNKLTTDMQALFEKNVIHVSKGERTETAEAVMRMAYHDHHKNKEGYFWASRNICEKVAEMDDETYAAFQSKLSRYHQLLTANKIDDISLSANAGQSKSNRSNLFLLSPFFVLGTIIWWIPAKLGKWITDKTVTRIDFYTSVYNGVLGFLGLIWWVLWKIIFWMTGQKLLWFLMFVSPAFCYAALEWIDSCARQKAEFQFNSLQKNDAVFIEQMKQLRKEILLV
jgi:1-acyl-sn-glycerol-3-phosphate acyltransferase